MSPLRYKPRDINERSQIEEIPAGSQFYAPHTNENDEKVIVMSVITSARAEQ